MDYLSSPGSLVCLSIFACLLYFLPSIVARGLRNQNTIAILVLNLLTGWTIVGWIVALVWACTKDEKEPVRQITQPTQTETLPVSATKICPSCAEEIKKAAKKCRFCGELQTDLAGPATELPLAKDDNKHTMSSPMENHLDMTPTGLDGDMERAFVLPQSNSSRNSIVSRTKPLHDEGDDGADE